MDRALKKYFIGIGWFALSLISSAINDVISKYVGLSLHSFEVAFLRFFFSAVAIIPFIFLGKELTLKTSNLHIHVIRGLLLFFGIVSWIFGLKFVPVSTATIFSFSVPLFTLALASFFLSEKILWQRWIVTLIGFIGIFITINPEATDFNPQILIFILSSIAFAMLDIINKKFIVQESMLSMLFYSALVTSILAFPAALYYWQIPTLLELTLLFILGCSSSLILFFLLKAFASVDATALAPYRYFELIISSLMAYFIFGEVPQKAALHGCLIIIPATLFIIYSEKRSNHQSS
jgi:S-adenosylmethionine uptake transporter